MSTAWRENYSLPRIFKGRRGRTGPSRGAGLFRPLYPISRQTVSRVVGPLRRKDNSALGPRRRLRVRLRCREKPTSRCRNVNLLPFRRTGHECPFETELPYGLGPTDPRPTAVHVEPFPTSVLQVLIEVFATTTKICTRGGSTRARALGFVTHPHGRLLPRASFLPWGRGIGGTLERHPFSGLVHSAGELLHTP